MEGKLLTHEIGRVDEDAGVSPSVSIPRYHERIRGRGNNGRFVV